MVKEPKVRDLFYGEMEGAKVGDVHHGGDRVDFKLKLEIKKLWHIIRPKKTTTNYNLHKHKDVFRTEVDGQDTIYLIPNSVDCNRHRGTTIWEQMHGSESNDVDKLKQKVDDLERELNKKEIMIDKLKSDENEQKMHENRERVTRYTCVDGHTNAKSEWEEFGSCPDCGKRRQEGEL